MVVPGLAWAFLDHRPWPWDQAQYAEYTLRTLAAFAEGPIAGIAAMGVLMDVKAPGLTWLGMPFALLARFLGRPEPALLCATLVFQLGTLLTCYWSAYLVSGSRLTSLAVAAFIGSTPIFIAMNHQYLVEPLQTFALALAFLLALCARGMSRLALFTALCGVAALALAAKSTSPLYCSLPLLFAASALVTRRPIQPAPWVRGMGVPLVLLAVFCVALVINWYATHFAAMLENARQATVGDLALDYGTRASFPTKLVYWISTLAAALFVPHRLVLLAAALAAGALALSSRSRSGDPPPTQFPVGWIVGAAAAHLAAALVAYSLQINDDPRFLEPWLPATAILLAWLCARRWRFAVSGVLLATALAQYLLVYGHALGVSAKVSDHPYLDVVERDDTQRRQIQTLITLTCDVDRPFDVSIVGVQYPWLNATSANFYAAAAHGGRAICRYIPLESAGERPDVALKKVHQLAHKYFITVVPEKMPSTWGFVNRTSAVVFAKVANSQDWDRAHTVNDTVVIFLSKSAGSARRPRHRRQARRAGRPARCRHRRTSSRSPCLLACWCSRRRCPSRAAGRRRSRAPCPPASG